MKKFKLLSLALVLVMLLGVFASCQKPAEYQEIDDADAVEHTDYTSVYEKIGSKVTVDMVKEDKTTGLATVEVDGKTYELGMDFLSMAMVYNAKTEADYNQWFKLYMQRWNYLVAEVPLYSNTYYDLYNAKIENFKTTPFWGPADAIVEANVKEGEKNSVILGSTTDLSGAFRNSSWGKSSPGSSDLDIENLTTGYSTVQVDKNGAYVWNMKALAEVPTSVVNEDGTLTYTIKIKNDMVFSDGSAITAKNYIAGVLGNSTPVGVAAGGSGQSGMTLVGFDAFSAYTGEGDTVYFEGVKLIDDYTFAVTLTADYATYYYAMGNASFAPAPLALYLGTGAIVTNADGACGLDAAFYASEKKDGVDTYKNAEVIKNNMKWNSNLPWSGPYMVTNYDESTLTATLTLNPKYPGDDTRGKGTIETITYVKIVSETQMDQFKTGQVDVLAGITGGTDTEAALAVVKADPAKYAETHYDRAGYGKIGFRGDLGPVSMLEVRQAIMYTINRPEFAQTFTGGHGSVVHGPYYEGFPQFQAVKDEIILNQYTYSSDSAVEVLEAAGWVYDENGNKFDEGKDAVRYKKLSDYELSKDNLHYASTDGKYKTVKIDGEYYMPLAVNWYGTQPNDVTDLLITSWQENPNATTKIGMYITYTSCDFNSGLYGEYLQMEDYGWDGVAKCCAINFATGFNAAVYDYSFGWTINPDMYDNYSQYYIMDEADFWENYQDAK